MPKTRRNKRELDADGQQQLPGMPAKEDRDTLLFRGFLAALGDGGRHLDTLEVRRAWREWCRHRRERRHALTERGVAVQANHVSRHLPLACSDVIGAIERAIASDWRMFWIKKNDTHPGPTRQIQQGKGQGTRREGRVHRAGEPGKYRIPEGGQR